MKSVKLDELRHSKRFEKDFERLKKQVPRGQLKNGTATLLEWEKIKESKNADKRGTL